MKFKDKNKFWHLKELLISFFNHCVIICNKKQLLIKEIFHYY